MRTSLWRIAIAAIILTTIQSILAKVLQLGGPGTGSGVLAWELVANLLTAAILIYITERVLRDGLRLAAILFVFLFGIQFNSLIEAVFFQIDIPPDELTKMFLLSLATSASFGLFLSWITGKRRGSSQHESPPAVQRSLAGWIGRILVCDASYLFLYFVAGMIVFPFVRDFYAARALPSPLYIMLMQLFRGLVFTGIAIPLIQNMAAKRWHVALLLGVALSIVGGIAPLLLPNPYMPPRIRWAHGWEVGISNFIFGAIMGWMICRADPVPRVEPTQEGPHGV